MPEDHCVKAAKGLLYTFCDFVSVKHHVWLSILLIHRKHALMAAILNYRLYSTQLQRRSG